MKNRAEIVKVGEQRPSEDRMLFEPFFRTRSEAFQIRRMQTSVERQKFADAFALEGCLRCQSKERLHAGGWLCRTCHSWAADVLKRVMRARKNGELE